MSKKNTLNLWLTRLAWVFIALDTVLFLIPSCILIPDTLSAQSAVLLTLFLSLFLFGTLCVATAWLIIRYRTYFRTWMGWLTPFPIILISTSVAQGVIPIEQESLFSFFTMLQIVSMWSLIPITIVRLIYKDVGLRLAGWGSLLMVWAYFFAWRYKGNLVEAILFSMSGESQYSFIRLFNSLACIIWWIVPAGMIGFVGYTIRLLVYEFQDDKFEDGKVVDTL